METGEGLTIWCHKSPTECEYTIMVSNEEKHVQTTRYDPITENGNIWKMISYDEEEKILITHYYQNTNKKPKSNIN